MNNNDNVTYKERERFIKGCLDKHFSQAFRMKLCEEMECKTDKEKEEIAKRINKKYEF